MNSERLIRFCAAVVAAAGAIGAVIIDGPAELTLFMAVAVVTALAALDAALDRRTGAAGPWLLVVAAVLGASVPRIVSRLADQAGVAAERADHVSSVLLGGCVAAAAALVARPPRGADRRAGVSGVLLVAPLVGGFAAATAAHTGPGRLGSAGVARFLEALGWGSATAVVVAVALTIALVRRPDPAFAVFALAGLAAALSVVRRAAGKDDDIGWTASVFALLAVAPLLLAPARLGVGAERRASIAPGAIAILLAVVAAQSAIVALNDGEAWAPGAAALGGLAAAALALGALLLRWGRRADDQDEDRRVVFEIIAGSRLEVDDESIAGSMIAPASEPLPAAAPVTASRSVAFRRASGLPAEAAGAPIAPADPATAAEPSPGSVASTTESSGGVEPHLVDPATGLRSAVGLQRGLIDAFSRPRGTGEVSILMIALRNLDAIERAHGRVAATQAIVELARRLEAPFRGATVARFATDGFATLIDGPAIEADTLVERCTEVLLDLLDPVQVGDRLVEIDVAAGMAQCYGGEDVASFVQRANQGLDRAAQSDEPTLVAMP